MQLENIFVQIPTCIFWKDIHSRYLGGNTFQAKFAGLSSSQELVGLTDHDLVWADQAELFREGDEAILSGKTIYNRLEPISREKNQCTIIRINKIPLLDSQGKIIGIIGNYTEVLDPHFYGEKKKFSKNISISPRQADVLVLLVKGFSTKQIASELSLSSRTIEHYIEHLKIKLDCKNKIDLVLKAINIDIIIARLTDHN